MERKLPQLMSRKKDVIETEEKWKDGYEAVEVGDAEEEEGLSPIATTSFPCSVVKELCGLLHNDMARPNRRTRVLSDDTQVLTTLHCYRLTASSGLWVEAPGCHSQLSAKSSTVSPRHCVSCPTWLSSLPPVNNSSRKQAGVSLHCWLTIDCTHIPIKALAQSEDAFVNTEHSGCL